MTGVHVIQISEKVYCKDFLYTVVTENKLLPNPYNDYPFLIIENFLNSIEIQNFIETIDEESNEKQAQVKTKLLDSIVVPTVEKEIRKTTLSTIPKLYETVYKQRFSEHQKSIENFFAMGLTYSTPLQVLVYREGDFYIKHADDSSEIVDLLGNTVGFKCVAPERKLSTVLFGTSHSTHANHDSYHFEGGELVFNYLYDSNNQPITIYPKAGDMIVFFSNPFFSHEVKPITSGYRVTLVQWHDAL